MKRDENESSRGKCEAKKQIWNALHVMNHLSQWTLNIALIRMNKITKFLIKKYLNDLFHSIRIQDPIEIGFGWQVTVCPIQTSGLCQKSYEKQKHRMRFILYVVPSTTILIMCGNVAMLT